MCKATYITVQYMPSFRKSAVHKMSSVCCINVTSLWTLAKLSIVFFQFKEVVVSIKKKMLLEQNYKQLSFPLLLLTLELNIKE